jgi:bifunctional non-homologous end joining protein LigD
MPSATTRIHIPSTLEPQLCTASPKAPSGDEWLHELKYDGWRLLARKQERTVRLYSRGGAEWSDRLPRIANAVRSIRATDAWLDGEIVCVDHSGFPDFNALHHALRSKDECRLVYQVFDLPWLNGESLQRLCITERKARLRDILIAGSRFVRFADHVIGNGPAVFAQADSLDLEGIVSKRIASIYRPGERTRDWLKVKSWRTRTLTIGGVQFNADGRLEAMLVGTPANGALRYEGRVELALGKLGKLRERMAILGAHECPFHGEWGENDRRVWLRPELTVEIRALPQRAGTRLRH